jgi:activator of HSP90 ATPase
MTADKVTSDIYELRTLEEDGNLKIEWKLTKFKNNLFKPRNSYSACGSNNKIYIWGGLESKEMDQICLSDLIELDIGKD